MSGQRIVDRNCEVCDTYNDQYAQTIKQLTQERDEARAHAATLRAALEHIKRETEPLGCDYGHGTACGIALAALATTPAASLEAIRAEAGRERAALELRRCADSLWRTAETFIDETHPGWRSALKAASERCHSRAAEIEAEGRADG